MRMIDLFSGIGGFALAATWVWGTELEIVSFVEIDEFCQKVLNKNFSGVPICGDIREFEAKKYRGTVDIISGGFPCQPYSIAGKQGGKEDDRDLWPEMFRIIQEAKPTWVVGENVANFINMELERSIADLEGENYEVQTFIIPALSVGAPHKRNRVWIIANSNSNGQQKTSKFEEGCNADKINPSEPKIESPTNTNMSGSSRLRKISGKIQKESQIRNGVSECNSPSTNTQSERLERWAKENTNEKILQSERGSWSKNWHEVATEFCRVDDGVSNRVDRLKGLGNAIVPQVAETIFNKLKLAI